ncbi:hypothetical protein L2E82_28650 [Cichorium intybus]|uniref:Uncharacterized protein n=1 Tax=Cichorium intybus TaxID=13427 RepID=A0ACB9CWQ7_CICIN|nr:hypothetical protein L2E82_28650 [Cichorium intybus]
MEFSKFKGKGIAGNKIILSNTSSQPKPLTITDSMSMNIEEYMAYVQTEENQLQDLGGIDILQTDNTPKTLDDIFVETKPNQTQVQAQQIQTSQPNIDNQDFSPQNSSDEMTLEEFLIGLGVIRAPSQVSSSQQVVQDQSCIVPTYVTGAWDYRYNFPSSSSFAPYAQHAIGIPILYGGNMMPLMASSNGINLTMQTNAAMAAYARQHRRMIRAMHRQKIVFFLVVEGDDVDGDDLKKLVDHFEIQSMLISETTQIS